MRVFVSAFVLSNVAIAAGAWADPPAAALPPGPEKRAERREERRDAIRDNLPGVRVDAPGVDVVVPPAAGAPRVGVDANGPATVTTTTNADRWRYRWHNNQWWYYRPDRSWLTWNGTAWNPYVPRYTTGYRGYYNDGYYNNRYGGGYYDGYYRSPYRRYARPWRAYRW